MLGAVGSTGLATGPHLDYRMIKSGVFVNPLKVQSPPAEPISADEETAFQAVRASQLAMLDPAPATATADAGQARNRAAHPPSPALPPRGPPRTFRQERHPRLSRVRGRQDQLVQGLQLLAIYLILAFAFYYI